jgi:hypothetical protein
MTKDLEKLREPLLEEWIGRDENEQDIFKALKTIKTCLFNNSRNFWIRNKIDAYKSRSCHPYVCYEISPLYSFQDTFFGTMAKPSFIQDNNISKNLATIIAYRYYKEDQTRNDLDIEIGSYKGRYNPKEILESLNRNSLQYWATAEIQIKRQKEENLRAEMWVNGVKGRDLLTNALRGFTLDLYHPILNILDQEQGVINHTYPELNTKEIVIKEEVETPRWCLP